MAPEATNPYAPSESLTHEQPKVRRHVLARVLAIIAALLADPFTGAGFYVLGRRRPLIAWTLLGIVSTVGAVIAARAAWPRLYIVMVPAEFASYLAVLHVAFAKRGPSPPGLRRSLVVVVLVVAASFGVRPIHRIANANLARVEVNSDSMLPDLFPGDSVMVDRRPNVGRGDVIAFRSPRDQDDVLIKRVVATAGDTIEVRADHLSVAGVPVTHSRGTDCLGSDQRLPCRLFRETNAGRSYHIILFGDRRAKDFGPTTVPSGQVFVLNDNRDYGHDSREIGSIPLENIEGTATFIYWSKRPKGDVRWSRIGRAVH